MLQVRRATAPPLRPYRRGSFMSARAMLGSARSRDAGVKRLRAEIYARTTTKARRAREATLRRIARSAGFGLLPVTEDKLELVAAALKEGAYRSGREYLSLLKQMHLAAGFAWAPMLDGLSRNFGRSLDRGLGPARRAPTLVLEEVSANRGGGSREGGEGIDVIVVGAFWMLMGR